ncbi:protein kinase, partial [Aureobasidium melanogenum]
LVLSLRSKPAAALSFFTGVCSGGGRTMAGDGTGGARLVDLAFFASSCSSSSPCPSRKWQCSTPKAVGWSSKSVATCCGLSSFVEIEHAALFVLRICEAGLVATLHCNHRLLIVLRLYDLGELLLDIFRSTKIKAIHLLENSWIQWMYHDFRKTSALRRISDQHASDQILALCTQPRRILYCSLLDLGMQLRHTLIVERDLAADEDIQDNTKTPDINFGTGVSFRLQKLGCSEVEGTTERLQEALRREGVAQTEVDDFDVASFANQNVLDLQIAMHNAVAMTVIERACNLTTEFTRLLLLEATMRNNVVKHLTTIDIFKQHVPVVVGTDDIAHTADIRMVDQGDNSSFTGGTYFF